MYVYMLCVHKGFPGSSAGKKSTHNAGDLGLIPGFRRSPGDGNSYPLQYSGLENFMDYSMGLRRVGQKSSFLSISFPMVYKSE